MHSLSDVQVYLDRMAKPLAEKLKVATFIAPNVKDILDVGCADGVVTAAIADIFPSSKVHGIDLSEEFIQKAKETWKQKNLSFESAYLREILYREEKYDVVLFCSVLHEFFTYGEGISSVLKALADAHEILRAGGKLIIRDMILYEYTKQAKLYNSSIVDKICAKGSLEQIEDFEKIYGKLTSIYKVNHYLLKYWYTENWERESKENYVPVTFEQYEAIFALLGMRVEYKHSYTIPFLQKKWKEDFDLADSEIESLRSTGILVAEKI